MDKRVLLAFRAGQLYEKGYGIEAAFQQAAKEEFVLQDWYKSILKTNKLLDALIARLTAEKAA